MTFDLQLLIEEICLSLNQSSGANNRGQMKTKHLKMMRLPRLSHDYNCPVITTGIMPRRVLDTKAIISKKSSSLCPQQVLVFEDGPLQVDDPLRPQGYLQHPPHLDVHFCGAQDHHVVILQKKEEKKEKKIEEEGMRRRSETMEEYQLMFCL